MTEIEFYDEIEKILKLKFNSDIVRKPYWGSAVWLKIMYKGEEFRIKYRKSQSSVRLTYFNGKKILPEISKIGDYYVNPSDKMLGRENITANKSIYKKNRYV